MIAPFRGTGTALATPFNPDRTIDYASLGRLIDMQIDAGIEALVACGSTGEGATMTAEEKLAVIAYTVERAREHAGGGERPAVIAGTGSNVTADAIELSLRAVALGVDGLLLVSPYYNKPSQRGLLEHFGAIASEVGDTPVVLYNVPSRTGSNMTAETTLELAARHSNVCAIKEASADIDQCSRIMRDARDGFVLYSGEDTLTLPLIALGAEGVIAVVSNEAPRHFGDLVRAALAGRIEEARRMHMLLFELMRTNFIESNPVPVKEALAMMGVFSTATFRLPLVPLSDANRATLHEVLARLDLLHASPLTPEGATAA